jgi:hypothetical protein
MNVSLDVTQWRDFLRSLDSLLLYGFLKEVAGELRHRDHAGWRAVSDAADALHDDVTSAARRAAETLLARVATTRAHPPGASER